MCMRMDSGGDCTELMRALHRERVYYLLKARISADLLGAVAHAKNWKTTDRDADGAPILQVAEIDFARATWRTLDSPVRVIAVRSIDRYGQQLPLFEGIDWPYKSSSPIAQAIPTTLPGITADAPASKGTSPS